MTPVDVCSRIKSFREETKANYSIVCATQISVGSTLHGLLFGSVIRVLDPDLMDQYQGIKANIHQRFFLHSTFSDTRVCRVRNHA